METERLASMLHAMLAWLASRCDYAHDLDGMGFSQTDASLGHGLAALPPESWNEEIVVLAQAIAHKYRRQLNSGGFDVASVDGFADAATTRNHDRMADQVREVGRRELRRKAVEASKLIDYDERSGNFVILFDYDRDLVTAVRSVRGRQYRRNFGRWEKVNIVPAQYVQSVVDFSEEHGFPFSDAAQQVVDANAAIGHPEPVYDTSPMVDFDATTLTFEVALNRSDQRFTWDKDFIRDLPSRRWNPLKEVWIVGLISGPAILSYGTQHGWRMTDAAARYAEELAQQEADAQALLDGSSALDAKDFDPEGFGTDELQLFPFQKAGVQYVLTALKRGGVLIGDEMGVGKTIQALATAWKLDDVLPVVVVCQGSMTDTWQKEALAWMPGIRTEILYGRTPDHLPDADLIIINYEVLGTGKFIGRGRDRHATDVRGWATVLQRLNPGLVVFDEAHYLKNEKATRTAASTWLAGHAENVLLLTGTPVVNEPMEIAPLLRIMDRLEEFGGKPGLKKYVSRGQQGLFEFNRDLRASCYLRRRKRDVLTELPPRMPIQMIPVEISNYDEYQYAEENFIEWLQATGRDISGALMAEALAKIVHLRSLASRGKLVPAFHWTRSFLDDTDRKLLLFAYHVDLQRGLHTAFRQESVWLRDRKKSTEAKEIFQGEDWARLCVASITSGSTGHTLTAASHVALSELPWTPKDLDQSIGRVDRIGQTEPINPYLLLDMRTIDRHMWNVIQGKIPVVNAITDGEALEHDGELTDDTAKRMVLASYMTEYDVR